METKNLPFDEEELWRCPSCDWEYRSPIPITEMKHVCEDGKTRKLELV